MTNKVETEQEQITRWRQVVLSVNAVKEQEIEEKLKAIRHEDTLGCLLDPTRYRANYDAMRKTETFLDALSLFKKTVKGIGDFQ